MLELAVSAYLYLDNYELLEELLYDLNAILRKKHGFPKKDEILTLESAKESVSEQILNS